MEEEERRPRIEKEHALEEEDERSVEGRDIVHSEGDDVPGTQKQQSTFWQGAGVAAGQ